MIFLGACNPYKLKKKSLFFDENVGIKKKRINKVSAYNLLYTVYPLPDTMLEYIWDFGSLSP